MFTILKAKTHHPNTHYDVALTHQNLQWFWFLSTKSPAPQRDRERERNNYHWQTQM